MSEYAILKHGKVIKVADVLEWARWFESADRRVALSAVGDTEISTVFIGFDVSFGYGTPLWFETMCFGGKHDGETDRYGTLEEAMHGHERMVERVKSEG